MYGSMSDINYWFGIVWHKDMDTIIPMPSDYKISSQAEELLNQIKGFGFEQQITLFRDYVAPMGAEPKAGAESKIIDTLTASSCGFNIQRANLRGQQ